MNTIIQKFGGTSLASEESRERVVSKIINKHNQGYNVVVTVSAIGRKGNPYSTDSLIDLINTNTVSYRDKDLLLSCGEIISAVVLSSTLNEKGYKSIVYTGYQAGIVTDDNFGNADIIEINPEKLIKGLDKGYIVIVAGFQGANRNGEITTLGRGGSDITAVALGKALNSQWVEIYTDVDGIMTADPNIVPDAKVLENMCYSEVYQLAEDGAKVIHPKAVAIAQESKIPIRILNTFSENEGTKVETLERMYYSGNNTMQEDKIITAITYKKGRVQVILDLDNNENKTEKLMEELTSNNVSIDLINFFIDKKVFTIDNEDVLKLKKIMDSGDYSYKIVKNCCKLSAIGYKMRGVPGVMARIVKALLKENIKILQSSDSHNTIWCLIEEKDTDKAINALHKEFKLYQ
ncbi:aspartate kinase [Anaerosalibacter sp. Marseille-P3206]|uniref:aspartate kinase n=1 Tax=Anaerosalibacter sp. Marseille-P3206 TaxID=1871005 RepID=UPI0009840A9D|nr:aspartate kinase [Anaerosalibacter sp. Marseille-P3206]